MGEGLRAACGALGVKGLCPHFVDAETENKQSAHVSRVAGVVGISVCSRISLFFRKVRDEEKMPVDW